MNEEMSKDLYERAVKHMPGGVNSPVRAYKAVDSQPREKLRWQSLYMSLFLQWR